MARKKSDGSEPVEAAAEPSQEETAAAATVPETVPAHAGDAAETESSEPVEAAAEPSQEETAAAVPNAKQSRTGFAGVGLKAGDPCKCPDGRKGTVQRFEIGLICIPNQG